MPWKRPYAEGGMVLHSIPIHTPKNEDKQMTRYRMTAMLGAVCMLTAGLCGNASAQDGRARRVLYLTKSSGFEHSVVKRDGDRLAHSERILGEVFARDGVELVCTKDGGMITADNLKNFDTVMFYTSGDLFEASKDGGAAVSKEGMKALFDWIRAGGGFIGFHAATDTLRAETPTEYTKMVGGAFEGHNDQEFATLNVVDPEFPAMTGLPIQFRMKDEWYRHNQVNAGKDMHVLIMLDTQSMKQETYRSHKPYPITWCNNYGKGRVFVTALGHREDVWEMPMYQGMILEALKWTSGEVDGDASPNFKEYIK